MEFKSMPEDFIVEESISLPLIKGKNGKYAIYKVIKKTIPTLEIQAILSSALNIPQSYIHFPALKDKHSLIIQYVSIFRKFIPSFKNERFSLEYIGRSERKLLPQDLRGNIFTVTLRSLTQKTIEEIKKRLDEIEIFGFPNFFDTQRFGSYSETAGFIGKKILLEDFSGALETFFYLPLDNDSPQIRAFKLKAQGIKGKWRELFDRAPRSTQRSILAYLKDHPDDFRGAAKRINPRILSIFLSAYQSYLWNKIAANYLKGVLKKKNIEINSIKILDTHLPFYRNLPEEVLGEFSVKAIPLPSKKTEFLDEDIEKIFFEILNEESLKLRNLRVRFTDKVFLSHNTRKPIVIPGNIKTIKEDEDEMNSGKIKLVISFSLPPGSYATFLLKTLI